MGSGPRYKWRFHCRDLSLTQCRLEVEYGLSSEGSDLKDKAWRNGRRRVLYPLAQAELLRSNHSLRAVVHLKCAHNSGDVNLHRAFDEAEPACDDLVRLALQQPPEHIELAGRQI